MPVTRYSFACIYMVIGIRYVSDATRFTVQKVAATLRSPRKMGSFLVCEKA